MLLRTLGPSPRLFRDPVSGAIALGSYAGALPPAIDLEGGWRALVRRKKWVWMAIATEDLWLSLAIVRTGYAASTFAFVLDRRAGTMSFDRAIVGPPAAGRVANGAEGPGPLASFRLRGTDLRLDRDGSRLAVRGQMVGGVGRERLAIDAVIELDPAPSAISAIADLGDGRVSATEKRALAPASGSISIGDRRFPLDASRAVAGYDYTHGDLPRRTRWRWAFALGKTTTGDPIACNLTSGFVGEKECAAWDRRGVHPLAEPTFSFDPERPERPWTLRGAGIDLTFTPAAVHAQKTNLVLVRSRFLQPVGTFAGAITIAGATVRLEGVPGVVEDQDVTW